MKKIFSLILSIFALTFFIGCSNLDKTISKLNLTKKGHETNSTYLNDCFNEYLDKYEIGLLSRENEYFEVEYEISTNKKYFNVKNYNSTVKKVKSYAKITGFYYYSKFSNETKYKLSIKAEEETINVLENNAKSTINQSIKTVYIDKICYFNKNVTTNANDIKDTVNIKESASSHYVFDCNELKQTLSYVESFLSPYAYKSLFDTYYKSTPTVYKNKLKVESELNYSNGDEYYTTQRQGEFYENSPFYKNLSLYKTNKTYIPYGLDHIKTEIIRTEKYSIKKCGKKDIDKPIDYFDYAFID